MQGFASLCEPGLMIMTSHKNKIKKMNYTSSKTYDSGGHKWIL